MPHAKVELQTEIKSFTAAHLGSNINQHVDWTVGGTLVKSNRTVYAPDLVKSVLCIYLNIEGVTMLTGEQDGRGDGSVIALCGMNFRENIANLRVSCYNQNNDRCAQVLFLQHPREQGKWLRQNPHYAQVLTASFALLPRVLDEQHPGSPVIIPWLTVLFVLHWSVILYQLFVESCKSFSHIILAPFLDTWEIVWLLQC